jgi:drug/metabolite transporter (DMT)-like permease
MTTRDFLILLALSSLWGGSFLFMRIAAPELGPLLLIELRVGIAALALLLYTTLTQNIPALGKNWKHFLVVGVINSAIPFVLIATATLHITAGLAATVNATTPLFGALISSWWLKEPLTFRKIIGLILGFLGVAVLVGLGPLPITSQVLLACVLSLLAAISYGFGAVYTKAKLPKASPLALATYSQLFAALALLPTVPFVLPKQMPSTLTIGSTLALALLCSAVAYLLYFRLIQTVGATKTTMVTYLAPAFAIVWGVLFLHERLGLGSFLGFAFILASVALVSKNPLQQKNQ